MNRVTYSSPLVHINIAYNGGFMNNSNSTYTLNNKPVFWIFEAFGNIIRIDQSRTIQTKTQAEAKAYRIAKGVISD